MKIVIETIPQDKMWYPSWGNWFYEADGTLRIQVCEDVPELPTDNHRFLVALHELCEAWLCQHRGVTQRQVDDFDIQFEANAPVHDAEPGDDPAAPYRAEHRQAMLLEHLMANFLGLTDYGVIR